MARLTRYLSAAALALLLAACEGAGGGNAAGPAGPSLNGGYGTGSNREDGGGDDATITSEPTPPAAEPTEGDSTSRGGGYGVGSN